MNPIEIRGVVIGAGRPKIAVSLASPTEEGLLAEARSFCALGADIAEWRMDCFDAVEDLSAVAQCLAALRAALGERPLLATFRSAREGGRRPCSAAQYRALGETVLAAGGADLLDVELFAEGESAPYLTAAAHDAGCPVLLSSHDFEKTPPVTEMTARLRAMQALGGDVLKLAVMPRSRADVLALLQATEEAARWAERPLVTMSMGEAGRVSRLCGGFFGSCITFGAGRQRSAPGQMDAAALRQILDLAYGPAESK